MNGPAYRAAGRIAWRQALRAPWRSSLIAVLVALPIAALSAAAITIRTAVPSAEDRVRNEMGGADLQLFSFDQKLTTEDVSSLLPMNIRIAERREKGHIAVVGGRYVFTSFQEMSVAPDEPLAAGLYHLEDGRLPRASGEAALSPDLLDAYGVAIGSRVRFPHTALTVELTGTIVEPENVDASTALLGPGTLATANVRPDSITFLVGLPSGTAASDATSKLSSLKHIGITTRASALAKQASARATATGGSFAAAIVPLFGAGLIAAAAFAVGARRQLRTLGLIGAAGGEPRHVRATVLLGGTVLGFVGSCAGIVIGIAASYAIQPHLTRFANRIVGPVRIPIIPLVGALALGTIASTLTAYVPARSAAKVTVVEALAARIPRPRSPGRIAAAGLVVAIAGSALVAWATTRRSDAQVAIGIVTMLSGFLVSIPLIVTWVGRLAGHLPSSLRIAARDLARHGRRTGAALAAATIVLALPVAVGALTLSDDAAQGRIPYMASDQLTVGFEAWPPAGESDRLLADLRAALPDAVVVPLRTAVDLTKRGKERLVYVVGPVVQGSGTSYRVEGQLTIGDDDVLRALHAEDGVSALEAGTIVAVGAGTTDGGTVYVTTDPGGNPKKRGALPHRAVEVGSTRYQSVGSGDNYVISPEGAARLGLVVGRSSVSAPQIVVRTPGDVSGDELERARAVASRYPGAAVLSADDLGNQNGVARNVWNIGGAVLALAIVAVVVALIAAESRKDRAIMVAVGAAPRTRRTLAGASGWVVAAVAGALAVPAGFVPVIVYRLAQPHDYPIVVPWGAIAVAVVGVPILAALFAAALSREPKPMSLLRPIA